MNTSFKDFLKEYQWLFIIVTALPVLLTAGCLVTFYDHGIGKDIWATLVTSNISYAGTVGWGIFIFHNSWLRSKEEDRRNRPRISIDYHYDKFVKNNGNGHLCFFSYKRVEKELKDKFYEIKIFDDNDSNHMRENDYDYLGIIFKNHSSHLIYAKIFKGIFVVSYEKRHKVDHIEIKRQKGRIWLQLKDNPGTLAFNNTTMYFLGIEKELVDTTKPIRREIYISLTIEDEFCKEYCYLLPIFYNNGTIMYGPKKETSIKEMNNICQKPKLILEHFSDLYKNTFNTA